MRAESDVVRAIEQYADTVRRVAFVHLEDRADVDDIYQTVFMRYALRDEPFRDEGHERAWIIRVTINACRDLVKSAYRSRTVPLDSVLEPRSEAVEDHRDVLEAVAALPLPQRQVVYLHYYEGYTAPEMARILEKKTSTIYTLMLRARRALAARLREAGYGA